MQSSCIGSEMLKNRENNKKKQKLKIHLKVIMRVQTNSTKDSEPNTYTIRLFQMRTRALALHHAL